MRQTKRRTAVILTLLLTACGGSSQPAAPTTPTTPSPAPTPGPTPAPTPQPTPNPGVAAKCVLSGSNTKGCQKEKRANGQDRSNYYEDVQKAIRQVKEQRPELFKGHKIKNEGKYMAAVILTMLTYGYCAELGPSGDEVSLKINTNTYSEVYDIVFGEGKTPTTDYINTCRPAHF